jgi:hypothetical protein
MRTHRHTFVVSGLFFTLVGIYLLVAASSVYADTLTGSTVTFTGDYPILGNAITTTSAPCAVVPPCVFTVPGGVTPTAGFFLEPLMIDVNATTIDVTYHGNLALPAAAFDGYVLNFTGAPTITGVSIDPSSTNPLANITVGFTANSITIDAATLAGGAVLFNGDTLNLDVALGSSPPPPPPSVPEPGTLLMLATGIGLVESLRRKFIS